MDPESLHDDEWLTGWKSDPDAFVGENRFQIIADLAGGYFPATIFDLGCGDGKQAVFLKKEIPGVVVNGCDISSAAVETGRTRLDRVYAHDIDADNLPEDDESYDMVLSIAVLEHIFDVPHALREINRILRQDGCTIVQVPNLSFWRFRLTTLFGDIPYISKDPRHLQTFNRNYLEELLNEAGFSPLKVLGNRNRLKFLAVWSPGLFSEDIFILAKKTSALTSKTVV